MGYPAGAIVYELNNSKTDQNGGNAITDVGSGITFKTTDPTPAFGSHCASTTITNNNGQFPDSAIAAVMGQDASWTIDFRAWFPTKSALSAGVNTANFLARYGSVASTGSILFQFLANNGTWNPWGTNMNVVVTCGANEQYFIGTFSNTNYTNGTANAWNRITLTWTKTGTNSGTYKLWVNGTLTATCGTGKINVFTIPSSDFRVGGYLQTDYASYTAKGIDRIIFLPGIDTAGVEIIPTSDPTITNISPATDYSNGGAAVTITGTEFAAGATVTFGGTAATSIVVVSATSITCVAPAHTVGLVDVTVTNTDTGTVTSSNAFTYVAATFTSVSPTEDIRQGGKTATLTGTNFSGTPTVAFGGTQATDVTLVSETSITCIVPAHAVGLVDIVLVVAGYTLTLVGSFTYSTIQIRKKSSRYKMYLNNSEITGFQISDFTANEQVNFIDNYDIAQDEISLDIPMKFFNIIAYGKVNTVKITDKYDKIVFYGTPYNPEYDFAEGRIILTCAPSITSLSKTSGVFDLGTANIAEQLYNILKLSALPYPYTLVQFSGIGGDIDINVEVNSNSEDVTVSAVVSQLLELMGAGLWIAGSTISVQKIPTYWPADAIPVEPYLIRQAQVRVLEEYYTQGIALSYTPSVGGTEAVVYSGSGLTRQLSVSAPLYLSAVSAQNAADRLQKLFEKKYHESTLETSLAFDAKVGTFVKYKSFIFFICGKEVSRTSVKYFVRGILQPLT